MGASWIIHNGSVKNIWVICLKYINLDMSHQYAELPITILRTSNIEKYPWHKKHLYVYSMPLLYIAYTIVTPYYMVYPIITSILFWEFRIVQLA